MTIYEANVAAIKKYRPDLEGVLASFTDDAISFGCEEIENRYVLYGIKDESVFQLDSMYSSESIISEWDKTIDLREGVKAYVFGFGNGMFVRHLTEILDKSSTIFVYEPCVGAILTAINYFNLSSIWSDERVTIFTPYHEKLGVELFKTLGHSVDYSDIPQVRRYTYINYDVLFPELYSYFNDRVEEVLTSMESNRSVYERFGEWFARNGLKNREYIKESRNTYDLGKRMPEDLTAIVVSAGPSLSKNIELLKEAKGKSFIVACDSAMKPLLLHDIEPDIFVSVDANKSPSHFDNDRIKNTPIVGDFSSCEGALSGNKGPYFIARSENPHILEFFEKRNIHMPKLGTGGSVANTAFSWLAELGVKRIVLIGQDLAYTDNKSHADGATRSTWGLDLDKNSVMVEGMDGNPIKSSGEFVHYRNWFERTIEVCDDITVINATEGGARIHGAIEMPLREVVDKYCNVNFDAQKYISETAYVLSDSQKSEFDEYMDKVDTELSQLASELKTGIRTYDSMQQMVYDRKYQNNQFKKLFAKTNEITAKVENTLSLYYAECMVQKEMTELLKGGNKRKSDEREELIDALAEGKKRYELLLEGINRVKAIYE